MTLHIDKLLKRAQYANLTLTDKQEHQVIRLLTFLNNDNERTFKIQNTLKYLPDMLSEGVDSFILERFKKLAKCGRGVTLKKLVIRYGKQVGLYKWDEYKNKQSNTNTFEYKQKHYGWSKEQFNEYNKNRACTLELMIQRYGKVVGTEKWNNYREQQSYTNSLDYYKEKYGNELGVIEHEKLNKSKSNSVESLMLKYDNDTEKVYETLNKKGCGYSKMACNFFAKLMDDLDIHNNKIYTEPLSREYGVLDVENKKYFKYDFVDLTVGLCIEFNGDHYHGNPIMYKDTDFLKGRGCSNVTAAQKREIDLYKKVLLLNERHDIIYYITVWEHDYINNYEEVLNEIRNIYRK